MSWQLWIAALMTTVVWDLKS